VHTWTIRCCGKIGCVEIKDGFAGERLCVVPAPAISAALQRPVTRRLVVTDAGWFPHAAHHGRSRPRGIEAAIVIVCTQGSGWVDIADARHRIGVGAAVVIPPHTPHSYGASEGNPWTIWWCHFRGTDVDDLLAAAGVSVSRPLVRLHSVERAAALLDEVVRGLERDQSPMRLVGVAGAAFKLMTQIASDQALPERGDPLERAMSYLEERLDSPVRVADLASLVGVSASYLTSLFRKATGGGVLAYHTAVRMTAARTLLERTTLPVRDIAADVGYQDAFYFSRHFRRVHGMSPTEFRSERRG
jgi:AraC family transcriptional regulator, arabinose operon regulatory protein